MGLFTPAWKSNNEEKALAYIEKCENQKKLAQIVRESQYGKERKKAALRKLKDQSELRDIAVDWSGPYDSNDDEAVFERLTDQTHLASVAQNAKEYRIRLKATERLEEQSVLAEIAQRDTNDMVRQKAAERLTDQTLLAEIAKKDESAWVREKAAEHLTDQSILAEIARKDKSVGVRRAALNRITDQAVRQSIALDGPDPEMRAAAIDTVEDQNKLMEMAQRDDSAKVRARAARKLTDQSFLAILARTHSDSEVRLIAVKRITDEEILTEIAKSDKYAYVRDTARKRITDKNKQVELALEKERKRMEEDEIYKQEKRNRSNRLMSTTNGNFSIKDIDQFTYPEEIHDAYILARESAKRYEIDREPYEKLLNKLTYPDDIEQAIIEYKNYVGADNVEKFWGVEKSWVWQKLNDLNDQNRLLSIAKNARAQIIRWKACKLAGGHFFPKKGNRCRCEVCGFENHPAPEGTVSGRRYHCKRCKGLVEAIPFVAGWPHSTVTYPDGTKYTINSYNGLYYHEEEFVKKNDLF